MTDIKHILALPPEQRDDEIRKLISEYFPEILPKPWWHNSERFPQYGWKCKKCGARPETKADLELVYNGDCPIPDPIALDWNLAMRMRDECEQWRFNEALWKVAEADPEAKGRVYDTWLAVLAQPHHYILAAIEAKKGGE